MGSVRAVVMDGELGPLARGTVESELEAIGQGYGDPDLEPVRSVQRLVAVERDHHRALGKEPAEIS